MGNLERFMAAMAELSLVFQDSSATDFIVVTIPTHLAVAESKRLMKSLEASGIVPRHLVVNQSPLLGAGGGSAEEAARAAEVVEQLRISDAASPLLETGVISSSTLDSLL